MLLQTYRHNLCADIEINMGAVRTHARKELQGQAKIIKKSILRLSVDDKGK